MPKNVDRPIEIPTLFCDLRSIPVKFHSIWLTSTIWHKDSIKVNSHIYWFRRHLSNASEHFHQKGVHPTVRKGDTPLIRRVLHLKNKCSREKNWNRLPLPAEPGYASESLRIEQGPDWTGDNPAIVGLTVPKFVLHLAWPPRGRSRRSVRLTWQLFGFHVETMDRIPMSFFYAVIKSRLLKIASA